MAVSKKMRAQWPSQGGWGGSKSPKAHRCLRAEEHEKEEEEYEVREDRKRTSDGHNEKRPPNLNLREHGKIVASLAEIPRCDIGTDWQERGNVVLGEGQGYPVTIGAAALE